jgi:hypothetical protein
MEPARASNRQLTKFENPGCGWDFLLPTSGDMQAATFETGYSFGRRILQGSGDVMSTETIEQYKARILGNTDGKDPLEVLRQTSSELSALVKGHDSEALRRNPEPGKWSVAQIVTHLAESEIVASWRYRQILERNGSSITPYDQDVWERLGDYANADPTASLELFRLLRERNVKLLERLTTEQWEMYGVHAERGNESVRLLARMIAGHDVNHLQQIKRILSA